MELHQPLAYSSETCSPNVEKINLLAATALKSLTLSVILLSAAQGPVTNVCYIGTSVQSCTISGLHIQAPLLLLKQLLARLKRKQSRAAVRIA